MRSFGFLTFGHYTPMRGSQVRNAADMLKQSVDLAVGADELGVNGAYLRVHHFARQAASPIIQGSRLWQTDPDAALRCKGSR